MSGHYEYTCCRGFVGEAHSHDCPDHPPQRRIVTPRPSTAPLAIIPGETDVARLRVALFKLAALAPVRIPGGLADHEVAELLVVELSKCLDAQIAAIATLTPGGPAVTRDAEIAAAAPPGMFPPGQEQIVFKYAKAPQTPIGVELYDSHTGDHVCYLDTFTTEHLDAVEFMYREGNYGCDCNRGLFMDRAFGLMRSTTSVPCGHDRYFVIRVVDRTTRHELYEGDNHPVAHALGAQYLVDVRPWLTYGELAEETWAEEQPGASDQEVRERRAEGLK